MRVGVHLPNDGDIRDHRWKQLIRFNLLKALVRLDVDDPMDWESLASNAPPDTHFILRLYWPGFWSPPDVITETATRLPPILSLLGENRCLIEIGNEPNHASGIEGFGADPAKAREYGMWYTETLSGLRSAGLTRLGFPGLAVGEHLHKERTWGAILADLMYASDWVGCHCYWQITDQMFSAELGENWRWYIANTSRPVYVTEVANFASDSPGIQNPAPPQQAQQYARWANLAYRGGVRGAAFFILDGTPDWAGFRITDEALVALGGLNLPYN